MRSGPLVVITLLLVCTATGGLGCESEGRDLAVDVQTDFVPGVEFDAVEVTLDDATPVRLGAAASERFDRPHRVLERSRVAVGRRTVEVVLLRGSARVASRRVEIAFERSYLVNVVITRSCRDVGCPTVGATECLGARCVPPDCTRLGSVACPEPACSSDADCSSTTACARGACVEGACLELPSDGGCVAPEVCVPGTGCVAALTSDAGTAPDAATVLDAPPNDGWFAPGPDAWFPVLPEDCTLEGDEDGNGSSDCGDPVCAEFCTMPDSSCAPLAASELTFPTAPIPAPTHWYRSDHQVVARPDGRVCGWRDLAGSAHFVHDLGRVTLIDGAVEFEDRETELVAPSHLGVDQDGSWTVFIAFSEVAGSIPSSKTLLHTFAARPLPMAPDHFATLYYGWTGSSGDGNACIRGGCYPTGDLDVATHVLTVVVGPLRAGESIASAVRSSTDEAPLTRATASGTDLAGPDGFDGTPTATLGGVYDTRLHEVIVYDRELTDEEIATVRDYLRGRHRP